MSDPTAISDPTVGDDKSRPDPAQGPDHDVPKFVELISGERTCMFTTVDAEGTILSRPMAVQEIQPDGILWFMAFSDSPKIDQLATHPDVNLTFSSGETWVSASGTAAVVDDVAKKKDLWNPFAQSWFQCEPEDPQVALIRVAVTGGEYWDSPSKPVQLFGVVKALVTRSRPADGENAKLDLA